MILRPTSDKSQNNIDKDKSDNNDKVVRVEYPVIKSKPRQPGLKYYPRFPSKDFLIKFHVDSRKDPTNCSSDCHDFDACHLNEIFWNLTKEKFTTPPTYPYGHEQLRLIENILQNIAKNNSEKSLVMEIGVDEMSDKHGPDWNGVALTNIMLHAREENIHYIGIDVRDCNHVTKKAKGVDFLQADTREQILIENTVTNLAKNLQIENYKKPVSLLLIDGNHSLNLTLNDFEYSRLVHNEGFMFLHDTNVHPGPSVLFDAIDKDVYLKRKFFQDMANCGCALIAKKGTQAAQYIKKIDEYMLLGLPRANDSDVIKSFSYKSKGVGLARNALDSI